MSMAGKTFTYSYENGLVFRTSFPDAKSISWTCIEGPQAGASGESAVELLDLGAGLYYLHWIEADGLAVTQFASPSRQQVVTTLVFPSAGAEVTSVVLQGKIKQDVS